MVHLTDMCSSHAVGVSMVFICTTCEHKCSYSTTYVRIQSGGSVHSFRSKYPSRLADVSQLGHFCRISSRNDADVVHLNVCFGH